MTPAEVDAQIKELDDWIKLHQGTALSEYNALFGTRSIHVMHANIGRNNNTFVDSIRTRFSGPDDFITQWIAGLQIQIERIKRGERSRYGDRPLSEEVICQCLRNPILKEYIFRFLTRNFYRNYRARVRAKPSDELWSIWFGSGNLCWGLAISPAFRNAEWSNDKSQMRRERYHYWTIGHVLETGLIDPESAEPISFSGLNEFRIFYRSILKRLSNSIYERKFAELYLEYLSASNEPNEEPLLIPELRYAGSRKRHEYRLDYAVLNDHTSRLTGFELSPASSHIMISGAKNKTQREINQELSESWQKEVDKRNKYFEKFGISIVTFADEDLKDPERCFLRVANALSERSRPNTSIAEALDSLNMAINRLKMPYS